MKILVVCQYYYPEPFRITDICEELANRGHEVMVLTGEPNYPEGIIYDGYENHDHSEEIINGVNVHRCRIIPRKTGSLFRFLNYYSFALSSVYYVFSGKCKSNDGGPFDVVFVNQLSPVMMAYPAIAYKKKHGIPLVLYCLDLWPESLLAGGITKDSLIYKLFDLVSKRIYKKADTIAVSSKLFADYFDTHFKIDSRHIIYLPQYAEDLFQPTTLSHNNNNNRRVYELTFAGNIGSMQSVETIIKAAALIQNEPVHFNIIGSGSEYNNLVHLAETLGVDNVTFHGRKPVEEMPKYYSLSDAMIITLANDPVLSLTLPGKIQSYMAAGKPIIGAINGEAATVINSANCGFCGSPEDEFELANNIVSFVNRTDKQQMGENARKYYETNFSKYRFFLRLENELFVQ